MTTGAEVLETERARLGANRVRAVALRTVDSRAAGTLDIVAARLEYGEL